MAKRVNLCPNPGLKANATGWAFPSGWGRSTSVTTLPRTTGMKGASAPSNDIVSPKCAVVAGQPYCVSFSIHYTNVSGTNNYDYGIDWYKPNGDYLTSTDYNHRTSAAFGITERLEFGPAVAPTGAASGVLVIANLDSGAEITAVLFEQTAATGQAYFDGDSTNPKASWGGTVGNSISFLLTAADGWTWADSAAVVNVAVGPTASDAIAWAESVSIVASGNADDYWTWDDAAMVIALGYDERRGRVRINAFGLDPAALRAVVNSRPHGASKWSPVRGGRVAVQNGRFARTVDDYEFAAGLAIDYQIVVYATPEGVASPPIASAYAVQPAIDPQIWLKFIAKPSLNRRIVLTGWDSIGRSNRNSPFVVRGRSDPIMVTDVHSSRTTTIFVRTGDVQAGEALDAALSAGYPAFLHTPVGLALPTMYVSIGDYSYERPSTYSPVRKWKIDITEIAPPPPSIFGPPTTCADILAGYPTCADVLATFATCDDLVGG